MGRNAAGTYTLPAGNPVVPDTVIESTWANPTMTDLGAEITDSLSRDGKGAMRAELGVVDGTEIVPGVRFEAEPGSGMFRADAGQWGLVRLGKQLLSFGSAGLTSIGKHIFRNVAPDADNITEWQDSNGVVLSFVDAAGNFHDPAGQIGTPSGVVAGFAGATAPALWLECDGAEVSRTTYANLFAVIASMYGDGNGTTTFNVPDHRGQFLRGYDHGAGVDPEAASRTDRGDGTTGDAVGTKQADTIRGHHHAIPVQVSDGENQFHTHDGSGMSAAAVGDHTHLYQGVTGGGLSGGGGGAGGNKATGAGGAHSHTISGSTGTNSVAHTHSIPGQDTNPTGDLETRPLNVYTMYIIKT